MSPLFGHIGGNFLFGSDVFLLRIGVDRIDCELGVNQLGVGNKLHQCFGEFFEGLVAPESDCQLENSVGIGVDKCIEE